MLIAKPIYPPLTPFSYEESYCPTEFTTSLPSLFYTLFKLFIGFNKVFIFSTIIKSLIMISATLYHITNKREPIRYTSTAITHTIVPYWRVRILLCHIL